MRTHCEAEDGISAAVLISIINYVLLGFEFPVDGFYIHSFEIWLATTIVFFGAGNLGYTLLEYRLGEKELVRFSHIPLSLRNGRRGDGVAFASLPGSWRT